MARLGEKNKTSHLPFLRVLEHCKEALKSDPADRSQEQIRQILNLLEEADVGVLKKLTPMQMLGLCHVASFQEFAPREVVFHQGDRGDAFYLILNGCVIIRKIHEWSADKEKYFDDADDDTGLILAYLRDGDHFGELALIKDFPRIASAVAKELTYCLKISKEDYLSLMMPSHQSQLSNRVQFLSLVPQMEQADELSIVQLAYIVRATTFPANSVILCQGDEPEWVYFIRSGQCRIVKKVEVFDKTSNSMAPKLLEIGYLGEGQVFGEVSTDENRRASSSVISIHQVEVLMLSKADFLRKVNKDVQNCIQASFFDLDQDTIRRLYHESHLWQSYKHKVVRSVLSDKIQRQATSVIRLGPSNSPAQPSPTTPRNRHHHASPRKTPRDMPATTTGEGIKPLTLPKINSPRRAVVPPGGPGTASLKPNQQPLPPQQQQQPQHARLAMYYMQDSPPYKPLASCAWMARAPP